MSVYTLTSDGTPVVLPPFGDSDRPITYTTVSGADEVAVAYQSGPGIEVVGYDLAGNQLFADTGPGSGGLTGIQSFTLAPAGGAGYVLAFDIQTVVPGGLSFTGNYWFEDSAGHLTAHGAQTNAYGFTAFSTPDGAHLEWNATGPLNPNNGNPSSYTFSEQDVASGGTAGPVTTGATGYTPQALLPYANVALGSLGDLVISDNQAQLAGGPSVTLPGEPANAVTDLAAASLEDRPGAAVAWVDSGTDYVSIYDASTNSFGPRIGLDWGGASNLHVVALPGGGFAVSWQNGDAYKGEVFDSSGAGGGILSLAGDVAGIDGRGELYTVGLNSSGAYQVQTYAIQGNGLDTQSLTLANGDYVTATVTPPIGGMPQLEVQLHAQNGADIGPEYLAFGPGIGGFKTPVIAALSDGGYVVETVINQQYESTLKVYEFSASGDETGTASVADYTGGPITQRADQYAIAGLPDGGFVTAWTRDTSTSDATSAVFLQEYGPGNVAVGGPRQLGSAAPASQAPGLTVSGAAYTVTWTGPDGPHSASFTEGGGSSGGGSAGQTFTSDNNGDVWVGTAGNDTFNLGRGGDWVTGAGGNDTYRFAAIPWAGGHITDFSAGDVLDLTGLMATTSDTGSDGFADGYLRITSDTQGAAQVWANYHIPGNDGWWLVETLDGVSVASLQTHGDLITLGSAGGGGMVGPTAVSTSDATYTAPPSVNSINLTGSQQTVTANDAQDTTIWSNNTGNVIHGGSGDDTLHIGRGGDWVDGGAGKDVFVFDDIPWASATIAALYPDQGDTIDVSGILARAGYTGSDPIGDGYLKISGQQILADYHLPGNDGWWLVATVHTPGLLQYAGNGVIDDLGEQVGGTVTTSGSGVPTAGYDTIVMTGSNGVIVANDGGDTLIDQGSNNRMFGGRGNDTLVLGTSTSEASDHWGGVNTWVLNPQSTVLTHSLDGLAPGDRLDVSALLSAAHYTGTDPVGDGYVFMSNPPPPSFGEMGDFVASQLMYDADGAAGPQTARPIFDTYYTPVNHFHYADGFFVVS